MTLERNVTVDLDRALQGLLKATEKSQERGFAHSVLPQESVDLPLLQREGDVLQARCLTVTETKVIDFYHSVLVH